MQDHSQKLFGSTPVAFKNSQIKHFADSNDFRWNYSICSTQLKQNCILLVAFNCGASKGENYNAQSQIPSDTFKELYDKNELGSFQRVYKPLKEYLKNDDVDNAVQTNFCFFRSAKENQINAKDIEISKQLFEKLIGIIGPKKIIGFSCKLQNYFLSSNNLFTSKHHKDIKSNNKSFLLYKGNYQIEQSRYQYAFCHIQMLDTQPMQGTGL